MKRLKNPMRKRRLAKLQLFPKDTSEDLSTYSPEIQQEIERIRTAVATSLEPYVGDVNNERTRQMMTDSIRRTVGSIVLRENSHYHISNIEVDEDDPTQVNIELSLPPGNYIEMTANLEE